MGGGWSRVHVFTFFFSLRPWTFEKSRPVLESREGSKRNMGKGREGGGCFRRVEKSWGFGWWRDCKRGLRRTDCVGCVNDYPFSLLFFLYFFSFFLSGNRRAVLPGLGDNFSSLFFASVLLI